MSHNPYKHFDSLYNDFKKMQQEDYVFWEEKDTRIQRRYAKIFKPDSVKHANLFFVKRLARHSRQVVVKTLSNLNKKGTYNAINYIIRHSQFNYAVDELGNKVSAKEIMRDWKDDFGTNPNSKDSWHLCFSIREELTENNIKALQESVRASMEKNFYAHKYIMVLHTHQNNPHIHVVINKRNMITKKKLHFKDKHEIREFFNGIKDDFAIALNCHGLYYSNAQKAERENILNKSNFLDIVGHNNYYQDTIETLDKDRTKLVRKYDNIKQKIIDMDNDIKDLQKEKKELQNIIDDTKAKEIIYHAERLNAMRLIEQTKKEKKSKKEIYATIKSIYANIPPYPNKTLMFDSLKRIKEINTKSKEIYQEKRALTKETSNIDRQIRNVEREARKHRNDFSKDLEDKALVTKAKERYLDFILQHKRGATKSQINVALKIKNQINNEKKEIEKNISMQQDFDNLLFKHFNIKSTSSSLIYAKKNIDKKMNALYNMDKYKITESKIYNEYFETLKTNSLVLDKVINEKIMQYDKLFADENEWNKHTLKSLQYFQKEFISLVNYVDNKNAANTYKIDEKELKEINSKIEEYSNKKQAEYKARQEQLDREKFYKDFIEWLIQQRNFSSPDHIRKSYQEKAKNGTLEEFLKQHNDTSIIDYKVYLREQEIEKQKTKENSTCKNKETNTKANELPESELKESKEFYRQFVKWYCKDDNDEAMEKALLKKAFKGELESFFEQDGVKSIEKFKDHLNKEYGYNPYRKKSTKTIQTEAVIESNTSKKGFER